MSEYSMEIQEVINNFRDFLLNSDVSENIAKIILFGSQAKNTAAEHSDIDILIFTADGKREEKHLMDRVYDFMVENDVPIEVITAHINDLVIVQDYFLYNILTYGVEIYSMENNTIKQVMVRNILDLSNEYLESAKDVVTLNRIRLTIDAAYNAAELAVKALILLKQDDIPGSHGGIVNVFGQLYVKTNEVDKEIGRAVNMALKLRNEARYKPDALFSQENARFMLDLAENLINIASERVTTEGKLCQ